jgi:2-polyprenyl-3-methyl-5-hydroxy-6-metoxy-1,4-benzoquinol methylase
LVGKYGKILDYGCGHGLLVKDCKSVGLDVVGYDMFNQDFDKMPEGQFNLISLVEVIEHFAYPFIELDVIFEKLLPNGI